MTTRGVRAGVAVATLGLLLTGCSQTDVEGAARWRDGVDDAARTALTTIGESITLSPDDELAGRADTQRCPGRERDAVLHRVDATLDLAEPAPSGLAERVRAAVPEEYTVEVEVRPDAVVLGVVSDCLDLPRIQVAEERLTSRYRVEP